MNLNIAAYRFVTIAEPAALAQTLEAACSARALLGTILLAPEGINLFLAEMLRADPRFAPIEIKESESATVPFKRLKVKIKREIVTFRQPDINPALTPAPAVGAKEFAQWLAEGKEMVILDTRNTFEFERGAFAGSVHLGNDNFTDFAQAMVNAPESWKNKTVVTFCTGGIRCEKAAPFMQAQGFTNVYQLQGGILKYFEEVGHAHYTGECFVFDERRSLDAELKPAYK